jgi:hypothetical protein
MIGKHQIQLEILKWLREINCEWSMNTCLCASHRGHLETLKWAKENGCPFNKHKCMAFAHKNNNIIEYLNSL